MKTRFLTYNNETLSLEGWAARLKISRSSLHSRLSKGWEISRALSTGRQKEKKFYTYKNKTQSLKKWASELGVKYNYLALRLRRGMTISEAFGGAKARHFERVEEIKEILESVPKEVEAIKAEIFSDKEKDKIAEIKRRRAEAAA